MKLFNLKKVAVVSAFVAENLMFVVGASQATTLYSGAPGTLDGNNGDQLVSSVSLSGAQTISYSLTGRIVSGFGAPNIRFQLQNSGSSVGNLTVLNLTSSSATYTGTFLASGAANNLYFISMSGLVFSVSNLTLTYGSAPTPSGPSLADTQASLQNTATALQGSFALQNSVVANSLNYDCQVFDTNNVCVSAGGRNTNVQAGGVNNVSALLIAAYRAMPEVRIGGYLDQNLSVTAAGSPVNLGVNGPLVGIFGVWNENQDGTGTEVKVSGAYGQKNTTITRAVIGTSEAGVGSSSLTNTGVQAIAKYGFAIDKDAMVSPYIGIRYSQGNMGGYTEATSSTVTAPLTYSALNTNATTLMAGVGGKYRVMPEATIQASVGVETDTTMNNGSLSATGVTGLTAVNFNPNPVRTRPVAMLGGYYDVAKAQRVALTGIYRQEPYQAVGSTTVLATYTVGF